MQASCGLWSDFSKDDVELVSAEVRVFAARTRRRLTAEWTSRKLGPYLVSGTCDFTQASLAP